MFKLKNLFTSRNIENCSVIVAIGLIVFFTIDMYMLSTIEGNAINFTPGPDTCPTCYNSVPKTIRQYIGTALKHEKRTGRRCYRRWWGGTSCYNYNYWGHVRTPVYRNLTVYQQQQVDKFHECCEKEHPCREEKKRQCRNQPACLTSADQASCDNNECPALDPGACDFT